jgi:hypothetical protein
MTLIKNFIDYEVVKNKILEINIINQDKSLFLRLKTMVEIQAHSHIRL